MLSSSSSTSITVQALDAHGLSAKGAADGDRIWAQARVELTFSTTWPMAAPSLDLLAARTQMLLLPKGVSLLAMTK